MEHLPTCIERFHAALQSSPVLFFFIVHLTIGRTFSVLAGLWVGLSPVELIGLAWVGDMMNIPFFATLYELGHRGLRLSSAIGRWLDRTIAYLEHRRFYERFAGTGALGVVVICATPMWGCGMWSSILLARTMRLKRLPGTLYLSLGSVAGSIIILVLAGAVQMALKLS